MLHSLGRFIVFPGARVLMTIEDTHSFNKYFEVVFGLNKKINIYYRGVFSLIGTLNLLFDYLKLNLC